ncbi:MAG: FGGY-family carbohydrate kinase, partial [Candidatus Bathyarchaeia archaeon]
HGLIFLPYVMGAEYPEFDPLAKCVIFCITPQHTKAHFIRAIMESVAYMLRRNIELLNELGIRTDEIISIGEGAKSRLWMQIKSDVTNKVILTPRFKATAPLGAAILAGVAVKRFNTIEEACKSMVSIKEKFTPNPKNQKVYDKLYKIYLNLYNNLKGLFPLAIV